MPDQLAPVAIALGVALFVILAARRTRRRRDESTLVRRSLANGDAEVRRAAVFLAAEHGLAPYGRELLERAEVDADEGVRDALAEVVLRNQWEPADDPSLLELRLWAHGRNEPLEPVASVAIATDRPSTNGNVSAPSPGPVRGAATTPVFSPRGSKAVALVTGAGGPAGVAVIRALHSAGYRVIAVDVDGLAAGFRVADDAALVPPADDITFADALCDIARRHAASVLIPTMTEEMIGLHQASDELATAGLALWVPPPAAVLTCLDKWRFAETLTRHGLPTPATNIGSAEGVPGAWIVKPRFGRGSRDVLVVDRADELPWALRRVPEPVVQTRLQGREFTADVLIDRDGTLAGAVPRWRLETRAGCSTKGRTFVHGDLIDALAALVTAIGLEGPANVQGFISADGSPTFVEVNPRFSGGLPLALAAGADLVGEYARAICGEPIRRERLAFREGVTMIRRYEEVFE